LVTVRGVSQQEKQIILNEHNRLRQKLALGQITDQPQASNLNQIYWDDELAAKAQSWADNCQYYHNPNRHVYRFLVGENIARIWSGDVPYGSFQYIIGKWFAEHHIYRFNQDLYDTRNGHFVQMAWSDTYLVGCGYTMYLTPGGSYTRFYVCNYGPTGNYQYTPPYTIGPPSCPNFGLRWSQYYNGLCSPY